MSIEYYQGGIEVELTSQDGPIVSRTMPQDYAYRSSSSTTKDSMHQPRRSYDASMTSTIPIKRLMSFEDSMVGGSTVTANNNDDTHSNVSTQVWNAPPANSSSGTEKENEATRFLRSYQQLQRLESTSTRVLGLRDGKQQQEDKTSDVESDISSSAMASSRRRNRISQIHAKELLARQKKKQPFQNKTSINEGLKPAPAPNGKSVSFGNRRAKIVSPEISSRKVAPLTTTQEEETTTEAENATVEPMAKEPLPTPPKGVDPTNSSAIPSSNSPGRSVATNLTYSTGGSGRVYRTQLTCSRKYKGRVTHHLVTLQPDDLQIGRRLEGLENGFLDQEDFAHAMINALFEYDLKQQPLYRLKEWEIGNSTVVKLAGEGEKLLVQKTLEGSNDSTTATTATAVSEEDEDVGGEVDILSPPVTKRLALPKKPTRGTTRFEAEKTASLQYQDVYSMASAKGIVHFYEDRDEIWVEDYNFCFASRRFKFLTEVTMGKA